jgi:hypothetical protein
MKLIDIKRRERPSGSEFECCSGFSVMRAVSHR